MSTGVEAGVVLLPLLVVTVAAAAAAAMFLPEAGAMFLVFVLVARVRR